MATVLIVGGGISGLALAYRLQQAAPTADVILLEERDRPAGTLWTVRRDGFQVEIGPNGFLDIKPSTLALCRDVGLGDRLLAASESAGRNRYLFLGDRLRRLPAGPGDFLATDLVSWRGKLRLLAERFWPRRRQPGDESIDAFARRRGGREAAEVFADASSPASTPATPPCSAPGPPSRGSSRWRRSTAASSRGSPAAPGSGGARPRRGVSRLPAAAGCGRSATGCGCWPRRSRGSSAGRRCWAPPCAGSRRLPNPATPGRAGSSAARGGSAGRRTRWC